MTVSVCMATYNGKSFISEQVDSIMLQLNLDDELIIVDDASDDGTVAYLQNLNDRRINVYYNPVNIGHVKSFEKAISLGKMEIIVMADQDDIWMPGRVADMVGSIIKSNKLLVSSNSIFIDSDGQDIEPLHKGLKVRTSGDHFTNILGIFFGRSFYDGCTMGFATRLRELILPIPDYVESHDLWIAMAANMASSNIHLEQATLRRRVHGNNASVVSRPLTSKIRSRWIFVRSLAEISRRLFLLR